MSVKTGFSVRGGQTKERDIRQVRPTFMLMGINYGGGREEGFGSGRGSRDKDTHRSDCTMERLIQSQSFRGSKGQ